MQSEPVSRSQRHRAYERLAPSFGYETRQETRAFDPESKNGRLMVAVCGELMAATPAAQPVAVEPVAWVRVHPDGTLAYDLLFEQQIEPARKKSGAWRPLYLAPPTAQPGNSQ